jgi:hypothetical protein
VGGSASSQPGSSTPQGPPNPLWFRGGTMNGESLDSVPEALDSGDEEYERRTSRSSMAKRRRSSKKKSVVRQDPMGRSRGSVTYATVKNLLRGGGLAGRTAIKNTPDVQRKKSMGTISSRLKINHKFVRPTILTDAYHRVYVYLDVQRSREQCLNFF